MNLYTNIKTLTQQLMEMNMSDMKICDLTKETLINFSEQEYCLLFILDYHYYNELIEKTRYIDKLGDPTIKEIYEKNEKHKTFTEKIKYDVEKTSFEVLSGEIVVSDPIEYMDRSYEKHYHVWYDFCKPQKVKNGKWNVLHITWDGEEEERAVICYHENCDLYNLYKTEQFEQIISVLSHVSIFDLAEYGKVPHVAEECNHPSSNNATYKTNKNWVDYVEKDCMTNNYCAFKNGLVLRTPERRARFVRFYHNNDDILDALSINTLWSPYPKIFSEELEDDFIDPFKDLPDFFHIGCDGDLQKLNKLIKDGYHITIDDLNYCLRGACRGHRQLPFIRYLVEQGANNYDQILNGGFYKYNDIKEDMIEYALENGAKDNSHDDTFIRACLGGHIKYIKYFIDKGVNNFDKAFGDICEHYYDNYYCTKSINNTMRYLRKLKYDVTCYRCQRKLVDHIKK